MLKVIVLRHPQSANLLPSSIFVDGQAESVQIACGTVNLADADYSEANDFSPSYASWNSALFETSVVLTVWEHADQIIGDNDVAFLHSDIVPHFGPEETWPRVLESIKCSPIGLTAPSIFNGLWADAWDNPSPELMKPARDPMRLHAFDVGIDVWSYIKRLDVDLHDWALETQPLLIYSHQFACSRAMFDELGDYLLKLVRRLRFDEVGFWMPHVFERIIALKLAKMGPPKLTTAFWHYASSGAFGPGSINVYGSRPFRFYRIGSRLLG